jgi:hypothetical protein
MKKYLFGVAVIILCIACVIGLRKSDLPEAEKMNVSGKPTAEMEPLTVAAEQKSVQTPPPIVLTNGLIVDDTRENLVIGTEAYKQYQLERKQVRYDGADAKVTFHVVDQDGNDVTNADVSVLFCFHSRNKPVVGKSDEKGFFVAADRLTEDVIYEVSKKGHYRTFSKFWFMKSDTRCVQNGRWIPWNPTFLVTLKEMRKPIPMVAKTFEGALPKNEEIGFDCIVGDLLMPYGIGKTADFKFQYTSECTVWYDGNMTNRLDIIVPSPGGLIQRRKDDYSVLISDYEAPVDGYLSQLTYSLKRTEAKIIEQIDLPESEYLVFSSRVETDPQGSPRKQHFGKIYKLFYGENPDKKNSGVVRFTYYFNATPNDRNLEFDGKNNLLKGLSSLEMVMAP